ncbi:MAG: hypothetical protein ABI686_00815 [Acidobacteriota bacterium]
MTLVGGTIIDSTNRPPMTVYKILIRGERVAEVCVFLFIPFF